MSCHIEISPHPVVSRCSDFGLHFGVKAKENQDKNPTLYWLLKLHKKHIKQDLLLILVLVRQQNFSKLLTSCLTAVKNILSTTIEMYMRDPVKIYFGLSKIQVKV